VFLYCYLIHRQNDFELFNICCGFESQEVLPTVEECMRYFYIGPRYHVPINPVDTISTLLPSAGGNSGNLLIGNALHKQLGVEPLSQPLRTFDKKRLEEDYDMIVIGASNFLFEGFDFGGHANFLEKTQLPVTIIGLGAQAPSYDKKINIPEGTQRFVKIISERSTSLGVRGQYTAQVLNDIGIKNVRAIGCPSMYWSCSPEIKIEKKEFRKKWFFNREVRMKVSVNGSANVVEHSVDPVAARRVEEALGSLAFKNDYMYILQNENLLMEMALDEGKYESDVILHLMRLYGLGGVSEKVFLDFVRNKMTAYFDIEKWMTEIKKNDLVIGSRFHGCLIAILAGVPSFIFAHDTRTKEMCELLKIPHADIRDVEKIDVYSIYDSLDFKEFHANYRRMFREYRNFLDENNVAHSLSPDAGWLGF